METGRTLGPLTSQCHLLGMPKPVRELVSKTEGGTLGMCPALAEDWGSLISTMLATSQMPVTPAPEDSDVLTFTFMVIYPPNPTHNNIYAYTQF